MEECGKHQGCVPTIMILSHVENGYKSCQVCIYGLRAVMETNG